MECPVCFILCFRGQLIRNTYECFWSSNVLKTLDAEFLCASDIRIQGINRVTTVSLLKCKRLNHIKPSSQAVAYLPCMVSMEIWSLLILNY